MRRGRRTLSAILVLLGVLRQVWSVTMGTYGGERRSVLAGIGGGQPDVVGVVETKEEKRGVGAVTGVVSGTWTTRVGSRKETPVRFP